LRHTSRNFSSIPFREVNKFLQRAYLHDVKDVPFVTICGATIFTLRNSVLQVSVSGYAVPVRNVLNDGVRTSHKSIYVPLNNEEARQKKAQAEYLLISLVQTSNLGICLFQGCRCPWPRGESIEGSRRSFFCILIGPCFITYEFLNVTNVMQLLKTLLLPLLYMFRALLIHHQELTKTVRAAYSDGMR